MPETSYRTSYKVRISDADSKARLKLTSLLQMLQEIATEHAQELGVDYARLLPLNLGWAVSKVIVEINEIPKWDERVYIETWASVRDRITTYREFIAKTADGKPLFTARSQWILFDLKERRIARMNRLKDWPREENRFANAQSFDEAFLKAENPTSSAECAARNDDIDLNGHVNNSVFLIWALESIPEEFIKRRIPRRIKLGFLEEVLPKNKISALCRIDGEMSAHSLINNASGHECARINIDWETDKANTFA